ncbi:MAG: transketolase family protein [Patescibacteria group bacterium]
METESKQKLNSKWMELSVDQEPIRNGYGRGLVMAGRADKQVVAVCGDLTESTRTEAFAGEFPERFFQVGVAEQNLVTVASGLAAFGKIPFVTSYAVFSPGRNWEQIRTTVCYNNVNVKIIGSHGGVSVGYDGGSHQVLEDIALMRVLPRMRVIVPCDSLEAEKATQIIAKTNQPTYLRLARDKSPIITTVESPFIIGRANVLIAPEKPDVLIIACGQMVYESLLAAMELAKTGLEVAVINSHTIKPLDNKTIIEWAQRAGAVVAAEEHQAIGGLGEAVAMVLAKEKPVPIEQVAVTDKFGQSGSPKELLEYYGLTKPAIIKAVQKVITRKKN